MKERPDVYGIITERIMGLLEKGTVPWRQPWRSPEIPRNLVTGRPYRGINVWLLGTQGYGSSCWVTYKQAKDLGGSVRKGEKATPVVFWTWIEKRDEETGKVERIPLLRYYNVFNAGQCEGLGSPQTPEEAIEDIRSAQHIADGMPDRPEIHHKEPRAYYNTRTDSINMPRKDLFKTSEEYYGTLFHELTHSTGHESRLNRKTLTDHCAFGSETYSREELVAEMGSAYLSAVAGIGGRTVENSAAYVHGWLKALRNDKRLVVLAASQAQRAADFILGRE